MRYTIGPIDTLPLGSMRRVVVGGKELCLYHLSDGVFATDNICTHQRASLASGTMLDDAIVECPRHGSQFDIRTGANRSLPAVVPLATYRVEVQDGIMNVELNDDAGPS